VEDDGANLCAGIFVQLEMPCLRLPDGIKFRLDHFAQRIKGIRGGLPRAGETHSNLFPLRMPCREI
jgi:hypothetical protein